MISATGEPAVTARVVADAEAAGVWVNAADDPARCSVLLPAVLRRGPVTVAVATDGASPALASWLRDRLGGLVGSEAGTTATLLAEARAALHRRGRSTERTGFRAALDAGLVEAVRAGRVDEARRLIDEAIA
ncbi:MAG: hypothetical protein M5U14_02500 [Acidimicrobiia bacterium]|nr:hypothetical protein [Acidimicrobiia bacterium]